MNLLMTFQLKDENAKTMDNVRCIREDRRMQQQLLTQLNEEKSKKKGVKELKDENDLNEVEVHKKNLRVSAENSALESLKSNFK
jgi:hypothetical protein